MKILYFTKYSRLGASSRLRSFQYVPHLKDMGYEITVQSLFSDRYITDLYAGKTNFLEVFKCYIKRLLFLFTFFRYDKIVIEKELFPFVPPIFEAIISFFGPGYLVDFDDAIFHTYDRHPNKLIRKFLGNKINFVMSKAAVVICGNAYLEKRALESHAKKTVIIPTVIDINRYDIRSQNTNEIPVIGWIGTPGSIRFLEGNMPYLIQLHQKLPFELRVVGAKMKAYNQDFITYLPWTEDSEVQLIQKFDIGIMSLLDSDFEKGKCAYKLIQYMACGIPVVASAVGMNAALIKAGVNGYLVHSPSDWEAYLTKLIGDKRHSLAVGLEARKTIEENYTLQKQFPILEHIIREN